jgi:GntR family transcriptional regulator of vanillate catabolism
MVSHRMIPWDDFEHIKRTHGDHHRLLEAMLAGEAWRAEAIMREHVYSGTRLLENMRLGIA